MINITEVLETNKMIEQENLDVRTITMGINLLDCADKNLRCFVRIYITRLPVWQRIWCRRVRTFPRNLEFYRKQAYLDYAYCIGGRNGL